VSVGREKALRRGGGDGDGGGAHHERVVNRWRHARGDIWTSTNRAEPRCPSGGHWTPNTVPALTPRIRIKITLRARGKAARRAGWLQLISHSARSAFRLFRRSRTGRDMTVTSGWTPNFEWEIPSRKYQKAWNLRNYLLPFDKSLSKAI